jgi:molecular chaperone DnaK (HSP70)
MVKDSVVMVLDCGGGTVDITIHKLTCNPDERFLCEELLPSSGGCQWGSKFVDRHFEEFLLRLFGTEFYEVYKANAMARLEILKHFEMMKRKFNPGVDERSRLQLNFLGEELNGPKLTEFVKKYNEREEAEAAKTNSKPAKLTQRGMSSIDLPPQLMVSFFKPLFD